MRPPCSQSYFVAPRTGCRAVLAYYCDEWGRYFPVRAIDKPLAAGLLPFLRLSYYALPYLNPPTP